MSRRKNRKKHARKLNQSFPVYQSKSENANEKLLKNLILKLTNNVDSKGKPLTDKEINETKVKIADVENKLGITH